MTTLGPFPMVAVATPVGEFATGPETYPLFPGHEIAGIVAEVGSEGTKHAGQTMLLDVLAATRERAHYSRVTLYAWVAAARARTRGRRPSLRGAARVRG
jgi:threonine dehydrogenase-like Zn-dependent dehydrogenase